MTRDYAFIYQGTTLNVTLNDGRSFIWPNTHPNYTTVLDRIRANDITGEELASMMDVKTRTISAAEGYGDVEVTNDGVKYQGELLDMGLTRRIIQLTAEGYDVGPMVNFLVKVIQNPRYSAVQELYGFLEKSGMPITEDGHFIAYKIVCNDYKDCYSGKFDNSPGLIVQMKPFEVDDDRRNTCSRGLHVCSKSYLPHYGSAVSGSDRIVIVKIDPAHVVSVPADYNDAKMRVWKYEVIGELNAKDKAGVFEKKGIFRIADHNDGQYASWHGVAADPSADENGSWEEDGDYDNNIDEPECGECGDPESECTCEVNPDDNLSQAADDAPAQLYARDSVDESKFYPATVLDIRSGDQLYTFNQASGEYQLV